MVGAEDQGKLRPVGVGPVVGQSWLIRDGLKAGTRVVTEGFQKISVGSVVKPVETGGPADQAALQKPQDADETSDLIDVRGR